MDKIINWIRESKKGKKAISIGYLGNVVDLWERLVEEKDDLVDLGSDQTSLHNPYLGGYYPVGLSMEESNIMMTSEPEKFKKLVQESLRRHIAAIDKLAKRNLYFWDYGNAFLVECQRAGVQMLKENASDDKSFRYPSYMQDIMGDIFSMGFGPFRWVCTSGKEEDLRKTDEIACNVIEQLSSSTQIPENVRQQYVDNSRWIKGAEENQLVVGSQARILYSDRAGRIAIAKAFNQAIRQGYISAPIVLSRDHHDVSGTDSPFRETSNITDGSAFCADIAIQNVIGATWVSTHNGGGVSWGDAINGDFGMLLYGANEAEHRAESMLNWDVCNGVARRSWSGNNNATEAITRAQGQVLGLDVTHPVTTDDALLDSMFL